MASITITSAVIDNITSTLTVSGTSEGVQTSQYFPLTLVITDVEGLKVDVRVQANPDGSFTFSNVNVNTLADGEFKIEIRGYDGGNTDVSAVYTGSVIIKDTFDPSINTTVTVDNDDTQLDLSGTSKDLDEGTDVTITITDTEGHSVVVTAKVGPEGNYSIDDVDIHTLVDGELTVDTVATDKTGKPVTDKDFVTLEAGVPTINTVPVVDETKHQIDITGTSTLAEGTEVTLIIKDKDGNEITVKTVIDGDHGYLVPDIDVSTLTDGTLTIDTIAKDKHGNPVVDHDEVILDAIDSAIDTIAVLDPNAPKEPEIDDNPWDWSQQQQQQHQYQQQQQTTDVTVDENGNAVINIFGTSKDVPVNGEVTLTIVDSAGKTVIVTTTVDSAGEYSVKNIDANNLADGDITIYTSAVDNNGNTVKDTDVVTKETVEPLDPSIDSNLCVFGNQCYTYATITGTTEDLAPNTAVTLRLYDEAGRYITRTVITDQNGNYTLKNLNISALYDGNLRLETVAVAANGAKVTDTDYAEKDTAYDRYVNMVGLDRATMSNTQTVAYTGGYGRYARYSYDYWDATTNPYNGYMTDNNHDHINMSGHITNRSVLNTFGGDDVVKVGYNIDTSTVNLGSGDNTLIVGAHACYDGYITTSSITAGAGDDFVSARTNIAASTINLGEGDNTINVGNYITGGSTQIITASGDDVLKVGANIDGATVNLGNGDNEIYVGGYVTHATITTGTGEDTVVVKGAVLNYASINTGAGDDSISIGSLDSYARINGGAGEDTLHITSTDKDIAFSNILNVENIDLGYGAQWLKGVNYKNMQNAGVTTLTIDGDRSDWVYLGTTNGNNSTTDTSDGKYASWAFSGTTTEDGTTYNVYTYTADTNYQVQVEQGVNIY